MKGEIFVVTGSGQGHLSPCLELCKHLSTHNYKSTLVIPSNISSIPDLTHHPLVSTFTIPGSSGPPGPPNPNDPILKQAAHDLETHLSKSSPLPLCAIIDFQLGWTKLVFWKFDIPVISFFTFGACAASMEWGAWKSNIKELKPGEVVTIPGLPDEMKLSYHDLQRKPGGPPRGMPGSPGGGPPGPGPVRPPGGGPPGLGPAGFGRPSGPPGGGPGGPGGPPGRGPGGPPKPGDMPPWVPAIEGSVGLMFNTCDDLEHPFLHYMEEQLGMPCWGVGPLLPKQYWDSIGSIISDKGVRSHHRETSISEEEIIQWLDSKPRGSVLFVAFGSEVSPTAEELAHLAKALEECDWNFIWVIQPKAGIESYSPHGLEHNVGDRGLIVRGWAPQLLILSHPSTGGFLSHCGWNSTAEAVGLGVPLLAWPLRGDQYFNCMLAVKHLRVGCMATSGDGSQMVQKEDILKGIEKLMGDEEIQKRVKAIRAKFEKGFPSSSEAALEAFGNFIIQKRA